MAWQDNNFAGPSFETALGGGSQTDEDWEDWLRWDPNADARSPDNDISHSGSSKNDSPIPAPTLPVPNTEYDKLISDETLAPPLVVGEDTLDFGIHPSLDEHAFSFGNQSIHDFRFDQQPTHSSGAIEPSDTLQDGPLWLQQERPSLPTLQTDEQYVTADISGPPTATTPSLLHSPGSTSDKRTSISSHPSPDPPKKRGGRKRKAEEELKADPDNDDESLDGDGQPIKKTSHNVIEKRYRNNLNDKIVELRNSVPSLRALNKTTKGQNSEDLEGLTPAHKHNKATIMAKATEYIRHLEKRNKVMQEEMDALKAKVTSIEAAFNKSRSRQSSIVGSPSREMHGFLNVPPRASFQAQQYMQQGSPSYNRPPNPPVEAQNQGQQDGRGGLANKIMLGGMAGMMMMEGLSNDQGDTYGLGMLPGMQYLSRRGLDQPLSTLIRHPFVPLIKILLVVSAFACLILPYLTAPPRQKRTIRANVRLPQAPSLASPVELRRKAWLTAIQSVWVPKHFLLEVVSVLSKMLKMSVRRVIGTELFASVTGAAKEDEIARIKAWDIAIDAQLAGGDAEVSYYRLLLTLMASGTLPDSPTRLMQKAIHFRVFFWEVANAGYGNLIMFKQFTEKVGRFYWDSARRLQRDIVATSNQDSDLLPDHLAGLLELDCDEVLSDEMIQRAWNLAWNKPSANGVVENAARDSVIMDHAIRSPLDAVAAWYSNMLVDETLVKTFGSTASKIDMEYYLNLAVSIAPPASGTQSRALATKAVLSRSNRNTNIIAALDALPDAVSLTSAGMNLVNHVPTSPEVRTTLTLAKLISLSQTQHTITASHANTAEILSQFGIGPQSFTLLTSVATYHLLQTLGRHKDISFAAAQGLEDLACSLRIWVGTTAGRQAGLDAKNRAEIVETCLDIAKMFGGWDGQDSGYGSHATSKTGSPVREIGETLTVINA